MATEVDHGAYFTTLSREYYTSPEIYEHELERLLSRQWHYAAHVSEVPARGNYVVVELLGESVAIVRGDGDAIHAVLNVCRHRGHPVCQGSRGKVKSRLICPYHQWSYALDGALAHAPSVDDTPEVSYRDWGLHKVAVDVWEGMIFICLGEPRIPSASAALDRVAPDVRRLEAAQLKQVCVETYDIAANWKVLLENFQECYHCKGSHPELCSAMDLDEMYRMTSDERPVAEFYGGGTPLKAGAHSLSTDGAYVCSPLLGEFGRGLPVPDRFTAGFAIQPMLSRGLFSADHATIHTLRPLGVGGVRWISRWFVHQDAVEDVDYKLDAVTSLWRTTNDQDLGLVARAYRGVRSRRFTPGPLSAAREPAIRAVLSLYLELMGE